MLTAQASIAWNTVQRAMAMLNCTATRIGTKWHWQLPNTIPQAQPSSPALAQETPPSCPENNAQLQQPQQDAEQRATPENTSSSSAQPLIPDQLTPPNADASAEHCQPHGTGIPDAQMNLPEATPSADQRPCVAA